MRTRALVVAFIVALATVPATIGVAQTDPSYVFNGSGWGHGVGMSQYGANSLAVSGSTADQIINTYYTGVTIKTVDQVLDSSHWLRTDTQPLWIGLAQNQTVFAFSMTGGPAGLCKANDGEGTCPTQTANPGESWEFRTLGGGGCQFFKGGVAIGNPGTCQAAIEWTGQPTTYVSALGKQFGRGVIRIRPYGTAFHVSLEIGVEDYIYGIGEVPSSWPAAALQAQAMAARTYGLRQALVYGPEASFTQTRKDQCWCQLYSTVVDQNYSGYGKETGTLGASWVAAVNATASRIITHPAAPQSTVIIAYYSSSSGGHTDNNVDGLGHTTVLPYLQAIPDPHSISAAAANPYASWTVSQTASQIATALGLTTVTGIAVTQRHASGTVKEVTIAGTLNGVNTTITRTGRSFKTSLGLRSITFSVVAPPGSVIPGAGSAFCGSPSPNAGYSDVGSAGTHFDDINCMTALGVMDPLSASVFGTTTEVKRWQMAVYMTRMATLAGITLPTAGDQGFTDLAGLPADVVAAINQLKQLGLTKGVSATQYDPNGSVPRWQMAIFLVRLHVIFGFDPPLVTDHGFIDLGGFSDEAVVSINQLAELGVTTGTSATTYTPAAPVTKEQMASFLARLLRIDT